LFGKTRQAWYERYWSVKEDALRDSVVLKRVKEIREQMPRIGGRKLHHMLTETLQKHSISIGRDKLFDLLEEYRLLVRRRKRKRAITTDSDHPFYKYPNLIRELEVLRANHLWVSDITYISLRDKFCYLSLVTDAYSRKVVGYCLHPTLKREGPLQALNMALASLPGELQASLIHHSDRGLQYCCNDYIALLEAKGLTISMTEKGDPYENAIAERVNGILKQEFALDKTFENYEQALAVIDSSVCIYNQKRPHASCNYLTPDEAHQQQGLLKTKWKRRAAMV
jgi:transposase InsO family protein